jgi:hypothetical protein
MTEPIHDQHDSFTEFDAAYLLGALSPEDHCAYEEHLSACEQCSRSVRELAGLPGLLARSEVSAAVETGAPPETSLTSLAARVRRGRRRRLFAVAGIAALAVAAGCLAVLLLVRPSGVDEPGVAGGVAMAPLGPFPVVASVSVTEMGWGTKVDMSCSYRGKAGGDYILVAVGPGGRVVDRLAWWHAVPQDTARMSVGTELRRADFTALEVRTPTGIPVLRWVVDR